VEGGGSGEAEKAAGVGKGLRAADQDDLWDEAEYAALDLDVFVAQERAR